MRAKRCWVAAVLVAACRAEATEPHCCWAGAGTTLFEGPEATGKSQADWRRGLLEWRERTIRESGITGAEPRPPWALSTYVQPQVHLWDRYLYNETSHEFTVGVFLQDLRDRYGGVDSVLLWATYPNLGIDARNQWDMWRALPGGLEAVKNLTSQFHEAGVRVLWGYNPFDQGLREEGEPHWTTLARLLKETGGDGFNGDTMYLVYKEFIDAGEAIGHPIVGEAEGGGYPSPYGRERDSTWAPADWNFLGWGYYHAGNSDGITNKFWREPGVDRAKWLDSRGRRQTHVCDRWAKDRHSAMQFAHFNGVGYESWENVWGIFMRFTDRDAEALRRLQPVWRWLGHTNYTQDFDEWDPFTADVVGAGVYASRWRHLDGSCAWTIVNRDSRAGTYALDLNASGCRGAVVQDLLTGREVSQGRLAIEAEGYAALATAGRDAPGLPELLAGASAMAARPLDSFSSTWRPVAQTMRPMQSAQGSADGALVPRTRFRFRTGGVEIEGGCDPAKDSAGTGNCCESGVICPSDDPRCLSMCAFGGPDERGVDVQFPWESAPQRFHDAELDIGPFYMDRLPVTNSDFAAYLKSTGYRPRDGYHFLAHWLNSTHPRPGDERKPVVWVSLEEARKYCAWAGKRLPHAYEWQLAAQGTEGRTYPWGDELDQSRFPQPGHGRSVPPLPDVGSFPEGGSPFGILDAVGLVWQFTDSFVDDHTRSVLLKGSSLYSPVVGGDFPALPQVGNWYFPAARKLTQHNRLLLMDESFDRAATLGFRCVADHPDGAAAPYHLHSVVLPGDLHV